MKFTDTGIVISVQKFSDSGLLVTLFSKNHGIVKGMVKGQKKNQSILQIGNQISFEWNARLEEHLGMLTISLEKAYSLLHFSNYLKILSITSVAALIGKMLKEKEPMNNLYNDFVNYLENLKSENWLTEYSLFELSLLSHCGFGFDFNRCAVSEVNDNIIYISPKTASAVSASVGEPYKDKLFLIPKFFTDRDHHASYEEIINAINITRYFITKNFFAEGLAKPPQASENFYAEIYAIVN